MAKPKLPAIIYVRLDDDGEDEVLIAERTALKALDEEFAAEIGVYRLAGTKKMRKVVKEVRRAASPGRECCHCKCWHDGGSCCTCQEAVGA